MSGVVDNFARTEEEAIAMIRQFLSYLPSSVDEMAPRGETADPVDRREEALATLVPREPRRVHNAKRLIELVVDEGSFFPIAPLYGRARITGLARINGYPIGVMANDPMHNGGATDVAAGLKASRLMQLCDLFHLPLVDFADEAGLMVGLESEKQGIERAGARLVCITNACRMPWITIVIRRLYGVGGQTHHRATGMFRRYAWPSGRWGSMHIAGGAAAAYRREVENADDPEAKLPRDRGAPRPARLAVPHRRGDRPGHHRSARHPAADRRLRGGRAARAGAAAGPAAAALPAVRGLRVVDLSTGIAGAYCARLFAATGGDVVVAEPPGGSPLRVAGPLVDVPGVGAVSPMWEYLGAGKRSVVTDPGDDEAAVELLQWADVVVLDHDGAAGRGGGARRADRRRQPGRRRHRAQRVRARRSPRRVALQPARRLGGQRPPVPDR